MKNEKRLIDANALIEFIDVGHLRNPLERCYSEQDVVDMLESRPTVDAVEVVHGKWNDYQFIKADCPKNGFPSVKCSHCDIVLCDIINVHSFMYHYCPSCGAKMDGDGNG